MSESPSAVTLRPPAVLRVYVVLFMLVWVGGVAWTTFVKANGPAPVIGVLFIAFGVLVGWRLLRLGVDARSDGTLIVRNNITTRQLARNEIEEFRVGNSGSHPIGQRSVQVLLRDRTTYGLDVCRTPAFLGGRRIQRQVDQLNAWLGRPV